MKAQQELSFIGSSNARLQTHQGEQSIRQGEQSIRREFTKAPNLLLAKKKIGFLFVQEQSHHIPHSAPILNALALQSPEFELFAFVRKKENVDVLKGLLSKKALERIDIQGIKCPPLASSLELMINRAAPLERICTLVANRERLGEMDVLVSPETTCLILKTRFGLDDVKFVYTQHGAGDRAVGYDDSIRKFDHVFIPGDKIRDRMLQENIITDKGHSVVGYPKFDTVSLTPVSASTIFGNNKPTVLYNPHFDPSLSSWFEHGEAVLEFFADRDDVNLIFAPHVMLYTRRLHIAGNLAALKWRKEIKNRFKNARNIHIDTGSSASIDMTYTRMADIYLGDVSSQVYEFIHRPRPCIFLNSHNIEWRNDPNFSHWRLGNVISHPEELGAILQNIDDTQDLYLKRQDEAFRYTFGNSVSGSANRAAKALSALA